MFKHCISKATKLTNGPKSANSTNKWLTLSVVGNGLFLVKGIHDKMLEDPQKNEPIHKQYFIAHR